MSKAEVRRTIPLPDPHRLLPAPFWGRAPHGLRLPHDLPKCFSSSASPTRPLQILTTAVTFLLFGVIYTAVYLLTSRFYYRIVTPRPLLGPCPSPHVTRWERMGREPSPVISIQISSTTSPGTPGPWGGGVRRCISGPEAGERRWGRERGCRTTARNPPGCTGPSRPRWTRPQAPRRSVARERTRPEPLSRPEEQPRPGYGPHPVQLHRSRLPDPPQWGSFPAGNPRPPPHPGYTPLPPPANTGSPPHITPNRTS